MSASRRRVRPSERPDERASIVFAGPVRDANGRMVHELVYGEAIWRLTAMRIDPDPSTEPSALLVPGHAQATPPMPPPAIFVPVYVVTQVDPETGCAAVFHVPFHQVRAVREPRVVVQVQDEDGSTHPQLMDPREAARARAQAEKDAALVRGDEAVQ